MPNSHIRSATAADVAAIDAVHRAAFPTDAETRLVALLIERGRATISLVAELDSQVVAHVLFSPATIHRRPHAPREEFVSRSETPTMPGLGLAPLAVLPQFQNQGLGSALVRAGLDECRRLGIPWVVVLGEPAYYGRFGFALASRWKLTGEFGGDDAFQFQPLDEGSRAIDGGHVRYAVEFSELFGE